MNQTEVYLVCDCSGSMAGRFIDRQNQMVSEVIGQLKTAAEVPGNQYGLTHITFGSFVNAGSRLGVSRFTAAPHMYANQGNTALLDAIGRALESARAHWKTTPALIMVFTDGEENRSMHFGEARIRGLIAEGEATGNLTVTLAGPASARRHLRKLGVPDGNFRPWDGAKEQEAMVGDTVQAVQSYTTQRSTGVRSSTRLYADLSKVTASGVKAMTREVIPTEVREVTPQMAGRAISDVFGAKFAQGLHFYELLKPEYIQDDKDLLVHIKDTGEYRQGSRAVRSLLGLPEVGRIRVHPGPHQDKYRLFVQSSSNNRKVVAGQTLVTLSKDVVQP